MLFVAIFFISSILSDFSPTTVGVIVRLERESFQVLNMFGKVISLCYDRYFVEIQLLLGEVCYVVTPLAQCTTLYTKYAYFEVF